MPRKLFTNHKSLPELNTLLKRNAFSLVYISNPISAYFIISELTTEKDHFHVLPCFN